MKKRNLILLLFFVAVTAAVLCACKKDDVQTFSIVAPAKVTLQSEYMVVERTDAETVARLTGEIIGKQFKNREPWILRGGQWYDKQGKVLFDATVYSDKLGYQGVVWDCVDGTINTAYFDELLRQQGVGSIHGCSGGGSGCLVFEKRTVPASFRA
jgi:hypothetical protein